MKIVFISVGTVAKDYMQQGVAEYRKRLSRYLNLEYIEIQLAKSRKTAEARLLKEHEKEEILKLLKENDHLVLLDDSYSMSDHWDDATAFGEAKRSVQAIVDQLLDGQLPERTRGEIARLLVSTDQGPQLEQFRADPGFRNQQVRAALGLILSLPEYHAC